MTYGIGMSAASNATVYHELLGPGLGVLMLVSLCYIGGRVHQFFRTTMDREQAYREGYDTATKSLFSLATRTAKTPLVAPPLAEAPPRNKKAEVVRMRPGVAPVKQPRHRAEGKSTLQETAQFTALDLHKSA
jgi:hypothetical protein